ncbi:Tubulin-tyrosine ligase/Tubulin polyglutamylase [Kalmanozyma brasiliensis GHG001]|uniref:Tubulin-tyrosine ligase n=1 Tax=Kalmanozyma brasiliensis (strain GHG001) TaxID=1365824 RepID=V5ESK0_KALBG|nr:Tubulin-tyrosine ligase/Tubulin polyglutamylase [Kalmanozyma brasiliensis GHG001]EST04899.1 Tubulin-tyrosine ligase/Tubulin polyglutamylase [Kalmanozyma brasiliensis GHG001]
MPSGALAEGASSSRTAFVSFPGAAYTHSAALRATRKVLAPHGWQIEEGDGKGGPVGPSGTSDPQEVSIAPSGKDLYLADYDLLPFEDLLPGSSSSAKGKQPQCSSYVIRKALIRKHYLASALNTYAVKLPSGPDADRFRTCTPKTWHLEIQFADELDELLMDDLYDLAELLEENQAAAEEGREKDVRWFILKPGMADRGNGIRIFSTLEQLQAIFEEFEPDSEDEDEEEDHDEDGSGSGSRDQNGYAGKDTSVMASQLRHFVIQEYIRTPLLIDPVSSTANGDGLAAHASQKLNIGAGMEANSPRKFHLRAYVLCVAGLAVYLHDDMLALFAPMAYQDPSTDTVRDLRCHLTNTCLQEDGSLAVGNDARPKEENVFLWTDLAGSNFTQSNGQEKRSIRALSADMVDDVRRKAADVIGASFQAAAKAGSIHWQLWPNAFEVFGVDLLVGYDDSTSGTGGHKEGAFSDELKVWLLEVNAQPDFAQTGARLSAVIDRLFERVCEIAVLPYHSDQQSTGGLGGWKVGESRHSTTLCFKEDLGRGF